MPCDLLHLTLSTSCVVVHTPLSPYAKKEAPHMRCFYMDSGSDLSSRAVSSQVLSALKGLTSVFGMGTGGTPSSLPPEIVNFLNGLEAVSGSFMPLRPFPLRFRLSVSAPLLRPFRPALACRSSRPVPRSPSGFPFCFSSPLLLSLLRFFSASALSFVPLSSAAVVCLHALALLFPVSAVQVLTFP